MIPVAPSGWPTWIALGLLRLFEPLPYRVLMMLGAALGTLLACLPLRYVRTARRNLELCLPHLDVNTRESLLKQHFRSLGQALFETAISWWSSNARILRLTRIEGLENLQAALARGHGAILLSAHFTTLEIGARAICARMPVSIMYRPSKNPVLTWFFERNRGRRAHRAIPRDDIRALVSALGANETVWYAADQSYRKKGAEMIPFFGIPAPTNTATSRLAKMTHAAILPYFPQRLPDGAGYRMTIHPALEDFPGKDRIADATRLNALIEAQVRQVPEQYLWIHKRFKQLSEGAPDYYANS